MPATSDFDRPTATQILEAAFYRTAQLDYAKGYIINEEDVRACVFRHVRNALDLAPRWRIFSNCTAWGSSPEESKRKPDLCIFHAPDDDHSMASLEIIVEIKHWPTRDEIKSDLEKLDELSKRYSSNPTVAFFAIVGNDLPASKAQKFHDELKKDHSKSHIWLVPHMYEDGSILYDGPYNDDAHLDPWRLCLRNGLVIPKPLLPL